MQLNAESECCQKKAYAQQSWPSIVNYIIVKTHDAVCKCNVQNRKSIANNGCRRFYRLLPSQ